MNEDANPVQLAWVDLATMRVVSEPLTGTAADVPRWVSEAAFDRHSVRCHPWPIEERTVFEGPVHNFRSTHDGRWNTEQDRRERDWRSRHACVAGVCP